MNAPRFLLLAVLLSLLPMAQQGGTGRALALTQPFPHLSLKLMNLTEWEKVRLINLWVNDFEYVSDEQLWGVEDHWATPDEFMSVRGGDCEDFTLLKYLALRSAGLEPEKVRMTYVYASRLKQAHMVLSYFPDEQSEPWVLDNLVDVPQRASERQDLIPHYSFNEEGVWISDPNRWTGEFQRSRSISKWSDYLDRLAAEPKR